MLIFRFGKRLRWLIGIADLQQIYIVFGYQFGQLFQAFQVLLAKALTLLYCEDSRRVSSDHPIRIPRFERYPGKGRNWAGWQAERSQGRRTTQALHWLNTNSHKLDAGRGLRGGRKVY